MHWSDLPKEALLDVRIKDLGLDLESSALAPRFEQLLAEFEARGFVFRPYAWLSTDWFAPDGVKPGAESR